MQASVAQITSWVTRFKKSIFIHKKMKTTTKNNIKENSFKTPQNKILQNFSLLENWNTIKLLSIN